MGNPYSFNCKMVQRSKGQSAVAAAAYQAGEKLRDQRTGQKYNYHKKKQGVAWTEILAPENSPVWAAKRGELWNMAEAAEKRVDGQPARRIILALPKELSSEERKKYARQYIKEQFVDKGMVADFAIHLPCPKKNNDNHHLHLLLTTRDIGPGGFGAKNRNWNQKSLLNEWREKWALATNQALANAGFEPCWDHRTLEEQGIDRLPQVHLGQSTLELESRGQGTDRGDRALRVDQANQILGKMKELDKELENEKRVGSGEASAQRATATADRSPGGKNKQQNQQIRRGGGGNEKGASAPSPAPKKHNQHVDRQVEEKMKRNPTPTPIPADEWAARIAARRLRKSWNAEKKSFERPPAELTFEQRQARQQLVERWNFLSDAPALRRRVAMEDPATAERLQKLEEEAFRARKQEEEAARAFQFLMSQFNELRPWQFIEKSKIEKKQRLEEEKKKAARAEKMRILQDEEKLIEAAANREKVEQFQWQQEEKREKEKKALLAREAQQNQEAERIAQDRERKKQECALKPKSQKKKSYAPRG